MKLQEAKNMIPRLLQVFEPERSKKIFQFQEFIWNYHPNPSEEELCEILDDLAMDLDLYEPNPEWRKECPGCYYGEEKLIENIKEALRSIEALEMKNQNIQNKKD